MLGVTRTAAGEIILAGEGPLTIGVPSGSQVSPEELARVAAALRRAGLDCREQPDIELALWEKLLVNVGLNPLTALLRVPNGALLKLPEAWELALAAAREAQQVARADGAPPGPGPGGTPAPGVPGHRGQSLLHAPGRPGGPAYGNRRPQRPGGLPGAGPGGPHPGKPAPQPTSPVLGAGGTVSGWLRRAPAPGPDSVSEERRSCPGRPPPARRGGLRPQPR